MSVERNKDGSVTIKSENSVCTIGVFCSKRKENFQQWVEDCAKLVTACAHTFKETEQYFLQICDALPLTPNDRRMDVFKCNIIMNHCKDKLAHQPSAFSLDMTDEEVEKWHREQKAIHYEAMNASPENFGFNIRGYYLPYTERNAVIYEQSYLETQRLMKHIEHTSEQIEEQDICCFFEDTTEQFHYECGGSLTQKLIVFRGVSEDDIKGHSLRFLEYISTLRDMGELPDLPEE